MLSEQQHTAIYKYALIGTGITLPIHMHLNVACLVILTLNWLIEGQYRTKLLSIKKEPLATLSFLFFLWFVVQLAFTNNPEVGRFAIEKKGAFIIVPLLLFTKKDLITTWIPNIMRAFTISISGVLLFCLLVATYNAIHIPSTDYFLYHNLSSYANQSAIYLSLLCMLAAIYTLYSIKKSYTKKSSDYLLYTFLLICIVLLSSKLHIVLFSLVSLALAMPNYKNNPSIFKLISLAFLGIALVLLFTNNPIKQRYKDIKIERLHMLQQTQYSSSDYFDGLSMRLLFMRFGYEILNEHKAWLKGVSPGNNQVYLNGKIRTYHLYTGDPNKGTTGYLNYEYHNQYMETLVGCGLIGLGLLLSILTIAFRSAILFKNSLLLSYLFVFSICFLTEALLEMEIGVVSFTFFTCLLTLPRPIETPVYEEPLLYV